MGFSAITARLGLDAAPFNASLAGAVSAAQKGGQQIEGALQFRGANAVKRQIAGITQGLVAGGSAADLMSGSMLHLANTLKLGVGGAIGLGIGAVLTKQFAEAIDEAEQLQRVINKLSGPTIAAPFRTMGDIQESFKASSDETKKLDEQLSRHWLIDLPKKIAANPAEFLKTAGDPVQMAMFAASPNDSRRDALKKGHEQQGLFLEQATKKEEALAAVEKERLDHGEKAAKLARLEIEEKEELFKISQQFTGDVASPSAVKLTAAVKARFGHERERIEADDARHTQAASAGLSDTSSKQGMAFVGITDKSLAAAMDYDRINAEILAVSKEETTTDAEKIAQATKLAALGGELAVKQAQRKQLEDDALRTAKDAANVAGLAAAGDAYGAEQARIQADFAERNLKATREGLQIHEQLAAQEAAALAESTHRHQAEVRHGKDSIEDARLEAQLSDASVKDKFAASELEEKLLAKKAAQASADVAAAVGENEKNAALAREIAAQGQLKTAVDARKKTEDDTLTALKAQTKEINLRTGGKNSLAAHAAIEEKYRQEEMGKSPAEKKALEAKKAAELRGLDVDDQLKTPEERRAEKAEERRRARAAKIVDARNHPKNANGAGHDWGDFDKKFQKPPQGAVDALAAAGQLAAGIGLQAAGGMAAAGGGGEGIDFGSALDAHAQTLCTKLDSINFGLGD